MIWMLFSMFCVAFLGCYSAIRLYVWEDARKARTPDEAYDAEDWDLDDLSDEDLAAKCDEAVTICPSCDGVGSHDWSCDEGSRDLRSPREIRKARETRDALAFDLE